MSLAWDGVIRNRHHSRLDTSGQPEARGLRARARAAELDGTHAEACLAWDRLSSGRGSLLGKERRQPPCSSQPIGPYEELGDGRVVTRRRLARDTCTGVWGADGRLGQFQRLVEERKPARRWLATHRSAEVES